MHATLALESQLALQGTPGDSGLFVAKRLTSRVEIDAILELLEESKVLYWHNGRDVLAMPLQYNTLAAERDIIDQFGESNPCFGGWKTSHRSILTVTYKIYNMYVKVRIPEDSSRHLLGACRPFECGFGADSARCG